MQLLLRPSFLFLTSTEQVPFCESHLHLPDGVGVGEVFGQAQRFVEILASVLPAPLSQTEPSQYM
jgi:hypothetical protein